METPIHHVNSKGVSNARHKSVSAHIRYQETDIESEGNRKIALLEKNNPVAAAAFEGTKNSKQNLQPDNIEPPASKLQESSSKDTSEACSFLESDIGEKLTCTPKGPQAMYDAYSNTQDNNYDDKDKYSKI